MDDADTDAGGVGMTDDYPLPPPQRLFLPALSRGFSGGFTAPSPKHLDQVLKLDTLTEKSGEEISSIWAQARPKEGGGSCKQGRGHKEAS